MSWITELCKIYDIEQHMAGVETPEATLLPLFHSTQNAQIEITITNKGEFFSANEVSADDNVTIVPVTDDSNSRSSGPAPHALCDKLMYIAGDYSQYVKGKSKKKDIYQECYTPYLTNLDKWRLSEYSDNLIEAIYNYVKQGTVIRDLITCGLFKLADDGQCLDEKHKIQTKSQEDCFIRFIVVNTSTGETVKVWKSKELYKKYSSYCGSLGSEIDLCYATGKLSPVTYKHMSKIRNAGDKAKLISSNDTSNFTYRGIFKNDHETYALGRLTSQKAHLALRWLIQRQGTRMGSAYYITWESQLNQVPDVSEGLDLSMIDIVGEFDTDEDKKPVAKTSAEYSKLIDSVIRGYRQKLEFDSKIMLMVVDAATPGRLSVVMYEEYAESEFYKNLKKWYDGVAWHSCYFTKDKKRVDCVQTPVPYEIIKCTYGTERNGKIAVDSKLAGYVAKQLYPCIVKGVKLPQSILKAVFNRVANPQQYSKSYNWEGVLDVACALFRKHYIETKGVEYNMTLDKDCNDRSYLFGRLAAIADKVEYDTFDKSEERITNAKRFMSALISSPFKTWGYLYERILPYMEKVAKNNYGFYVNYEKEFQKIVSLFKDDDFKKNAALDAMFFMGFYAQKQELFKEKENKEKNNNEKTEDK